MQLDSGSDGNSTCWYWAVFRLRPSAGPELWARNSAAGFPPAELVDGVAAELVRVARVSTAWRCRLCGGVRRGRFFEPENGPSDARKALDSLSCGACECALADKCRRSLDTSLEFPFGLFLLRLQRDELAHFGWEQGRLSVLFADEHFCGGSGAPLDLGNEPTASSGWIFVVGTLREVAQSEAEALLRRLKALHWRALRDGALDEGLASAYFHRLRQTLSRLTPQRLLRGKDERFAEEASPAAAASLFSTHWQSDSFPQAPLPKQSASDLGKKSAGAQQQLLEGAAFLSAGVARDNRSAASRRWEPSRRSLEGLFVSERRLFPTPLLDSAWGEARDLPFPQPRPSRASAAPGLFAQRLGAADLQTPPAAASLAQQTMACEESRRRAAHGEDEELSESAARQLAAIESARAKAEALRELLLQNLQLSAAASSAAAATQASAESLPTRSAALRGAAVSLLRRQRMRQARKVALVAVVAAAVFLTQRLCRV